jgi:DNA recombination protein RmuC
LGNQILYVLLSALLAFAAGALVFYRIGQLRGRRDAEPDMVGLRRDAATAREQFEDARRRAADFEQALTDERRRSDALSDERAALAARAERVGAVDAQLTQLRAELDQVRTSRDVAERRGAELQARLEEQQQAAGDRLRELEGSRERMKTEFQALAAEILEDKSRRFSAQNAEQIGGLLTPLREEIGGFRKLVNDSYEKEGNARVFLQAELKQLLELNRRLSDEATSLTRALTSDNRTQGYWGELKLERLLESAGLEKGKQYLTQESFRDAEGDRYRPDAVLLLPEGRHIVIDAKMTLVDYQRACEAADDGEREQHMVRHAAAMRVHVKQLGEKDYSRLEGMNSPDLVLLFVPVEAAFLEAMRRDVGLYDDAFQRKIILVGPGNLLASLRLIAQIWRTEQQTRNAKAIADRAGILYDKFVGFAEDMGKIGEAIRRADGLHKSALDKLSQGRGNLVRQAEMLRELGVAPSKRLPASLQDVSDDGEAKDLE